MSWTRARLLGIGAVGLVLIGPGCGGDDSSSSTTGSASGSGGGGSTTSGTSGTAGGGGGPCAGGLASCGGECIDLSTSTDHCGACDSACSATAPSTAECAAGRCVVMLASAPGDAGPLAVGPDTVYWVNPIAGSVLAVPKTGGTPSTFADDVVTALAADGASLFWAGSEGIMKAPHTGQGTLTLAHPFNDVPHLALDDANVYFPVAKVPKNGGLVTLLGGGVAEISGVQRLAADATSLFWITGDKVKRAPLAGGDSQEIAWNQCGTDGVVVDGSDVFWTVTGTPTCPAFALMKAPVAGGEWVQVASGYFRRMVKDPDASAVYAIGEQGLVRLPLDGGSPEVILAETGILQLAVDHDSVYWTTAGNGVGKVWRVTPK